MEKGKITIQSSIVVNINRSKRIGVYARVLKDLPVVLTRNIIDDLLLRDAGVE